MHALFSHSFAQKGIIFACPSIIVSQRIGTLGNEITKLLPQLRQASVNFIEFVGNVDDPAFKCIIRKGRYYWTAIKLYIIRLGQDLDCMLATSS
ncbi:hypothetical protein AD934_00145 [Gluconobacter oxydans]|uniref:Uncharacterized protein n=1 Tax=Gluconobacter oxydans TaxID=442 RepID=A0A149S9R2_GLUOY|nr:hypothetical protein AD934_00145 [Gluconobacter oxydans]